MAKVPPLAAEGLSSPDSRPRDSQRLTRKPLPFWDRIKFLLGLALIPLALETRGKALPG